MASYSLELHNPLHFSHTQNTLIWKGIFFFFFKSCYAKINIFKVALDTNIEEGVLSITVIVVRNGGVLSITVIVVRNGLGDQSSIPGRVCLRFI